MAPNSYKWNYHSYNYKLTVGWAIITVSHYQTCPKGRWEMAKENHQAAPAAPVAPGLPPESGSRGHPVLCRRPCIRLARGSCEMGDVSWICC